MISSPTVLAKSAVFRFSDASHKVDLTDSQTTIYASFYSLGLTMLSWTLSSLASASKQGYSVILFGG